MKLLRANGCKPTASPMTRPITTDSAKAMPSSQNVMRRAAGTPRVSNTCCSDISTRDGGLRNIGSIHHRAAISQTTNRRTMTPMRASQGRRSQRRSVVAEDVIGGACPGFRASTPEC